MEVSLLVWLSTVLVFPFASVCMHIANKHCTILCVGLQLIRSLNEGVACVFWGVFAQEA